ncbi:MAG: 37S ribosomal Mrp17 [Lasallia pustulata]|uniref:Small ribosomal subunit protein bS6m n=1 Tax=Lasallia pustulata TaxID=136370 RepID=A0A1W5CVL5_9LECA|nr:MAG: 37S ribosomal Mrp17 [Lasallia pustulata]SLM34924.1 Translation elongation factor EF1B/ribosomal protein S6 [Lasallia pustulata]
MLYELIAVVRQGKTAEVKEIARTAGAVVLRSGGVIRGITNWGVFLLTGPTHKHQARHDRGHHFIMRFDSSVEGQYAVRNLLSRDPRMVRFSVVKLGTTLQEIKDIGGTVDWKRGDSAFR